MVNNLLSTREVGINPASKYEFFTTPFGHKREELGPEKVAS
jgi:hypothetical protein